MAVDAGDDHCRAAGYHESAHLVIACDLGLPISPKGIYINNFAEGRVWFWGATDGVPVSSADVDSVVIALFAGGIAHRRILHEIRDACAGDDVRIKELLEAHHPDPNSARRSTSNCSRAKEKVDGQWGVSQEWLKSYGANPGGQRI